jgi:hypothetical protein
LPKIEDFFMNDAIEFFKDYGKRSDSRLFSSTLFPLDDFEKIKSDSLFRTREGW